MKYFELSDYDLSKEMFETRVSQQCASTDDEEKYFKDKLDELILEKMRRKKEVELGE